MSVGRVCRGSLDTTTDPEREPQVRIAQVEQIRDQARNRRYTGLSWVCRWLRGTNPVSSAASVLLGGRRGGGCWRTEGRLVRRCHGFYAEILFDNVFEVQTS